MEHAQLRTTSQLYSARFGGRIFAIECLLTIRKDTTHLVLQTVFPLLPRSWTCPQHDDVKCSWAVLSIFNPSTIDQQVERWMIQITRGVGVTYQAFNTQRFWHDLDQIHWVGWRENLQETIVFNVVCRLVSWYPMSFQHKSVSCQLWGVGL